MTGWGYHAWAFEFLTVVNTHTNFPLVCTNLSSKRTLCIEEYVFPEWFLSSGGFWVWRDWPQFYASLLPYSSHSSLSECWLAFSAIWMVNYNPHQQLSPTFGKDPVQTVEHLTYANMTLPRLFYEAHNNILEMEIFIMPCVANCCEARVLGRQ